MGILRYGLVVAFTILGIHIYPEFRRPKLPVPPVDGWTEPDWQRVEEAFRANFEGGWEKEGSAFAVYHKGELVVDLWGGWADRKSGRKWKKDTTAVFFSSTKAVCALAAQILVDRGLLDYDAPVVKYWPEFGKHGKDRITVRDLVSHRAGLAVIDEDEEITLDKLNSHWTDMSRLLENQKPNWKLGKDLHGYHAFTYGWLVDMLVRRVDFEQRSLGQFVRDEITQPHDLEFTIGTDPSVFHRMARTTPFAPVEILSKIFFANSNAIYPQLLALKAIATGEDSLMANLVKNPRFMIVDGGMSTNDPEVLSVEVGAVNGVGTARGLAGIFNVYNRGEFVEKNGDVWKRVLVHGVLTVDLVAKIPVDWNYGYMFSKTPNGDVELGHLGFGGQNVKFVPELDLAFAYVTNGLTPDMGDEAHNFANLRTAVYETIAWMKRNETKMACGGKTPSQIESPLDGEKRVISSPSFTMWSAVESIAKFVFFYIIIMIFSIIITFILSVLVSEHNYFFLLFI